MPIIRLHTAIPTRQELNARLQKERLSIRGQVKHGALKIQNHNVPIYKLKVGQVGVVMVYTQGVEFSVV
jgi:hypothetical protein